MPRSHLSLHSHQVDSEIQANKPCAALYPALSVRPLLLALLCSSSGLAWAYKVEKVCTEIAATASEPAKKVCKIVRKTEEKEAPKEEKKEEKKHGGH